MTLQMNRPTVTVGTGPVAGPMPLSRRRRVAVLVTLSATAFVFSKDTATESIAVVTLLHQLGNRPDLATSLWIPTAHVVAYIALLLLGGWLADRFGAKRALVGGLVGFLVASIVTIVVPDNPVVLLCARAFKGAFSTAIVPTTLAILVLVYGAGRARARAAIVCAGWCAAGPLVTPLIAAAAINEVWWPRIVMVVGVADLAVLIAALAVLPAIPADREARICGSWLSWMIIAGGLLALALHKLPEWGWASPAFALSCACGTIALVVAFFCTAEGQVHVGLLRSQPRVRFATVALGAGVCALFGMLLLVIQYLQVFGSPNPMGLALGLFAAGSVATAAGSLVGACLERSGYLVAAVFGGVVVILDGLAVGLTVDGSGDLTPLLAMVILTSFGFALTLGIALEIQCAALPPTRTGMLWAAQLLQIQIAGLFGAGLAGSLAARGFRRQMETPTHARGGSDTVDSIGEGVRATTALVGDQFAAPVAAVRSAFIAGYRDGLLALIVAVTVGVLVLVVNAVLTRDSTAP